MPIFLHLRVRVPLQNQERFHRFLESATPFYEAPGGIKMHLLRSPNDPTRFIELVEYATEEDYERDQIRVEADPIMRRLLAEWRELLDGPPEVEVWTES